MVTRGGCGAESRCVSGREEMSVMGENTVKGSLDNWYSYVVQIYVKKRVTHMFSQ